MGFQTLSIWRPIFFSNFEQKKPNNMNNRKYLFLNLSIIFLEIVVFVLFKLDVLAFNYGWEKKINMVNFLFVIMTQSIFLYLIYEVEDLKNQKTLYLGQFLLFLVVLIWMLLEVEIHYRLK